MTGIYLKCDRCALTLGGEQVTRNPEAPLGRADGAKLRERAKERQRWVSFPDIDYDLCRDCVERRMADRCRRCGSAVDDCDYPDCLRLEKRT